MNVSHPTPLWFRFIWCIVPSVGNDSDPTRSNTVKFLCVVRVEDGNVYFDVPSIGLLVDEGFTVEPLDVRNKEGYTSTYEVTIDDKQTIEVTSWENVHPDDWSQELYQLNQSFE